MKNLITAVGCVILLMAFVAQFAHQQVLFQQMALVNHVVDRFVAGERNETWLKEEISRVMDCNMQDVDVEVNRNVCVVHVPVSNILASPAFWGLAEEENMTIWTIRREKMTSVKGEDHE